MNRLTQKPTDSNLNEIRSKYEKFNLTENPFPSSPYVNQDSTDRRINGKLFEMEIRKTEYEQIVRSFLQSPQSDPNHLRLGYIIDTSYVGRGNGKSAFLVNLQENINQEYNLDISNGVNKCFAVYMQPEGSGRTKTFGAFTDVLFDALLRSGIISTSLAILRLEAMAVAHPDFDLTAELRDECLLIQHLNSHDWYEDNKLLYSKVAAAIHQNPSLQSLSPEFPLYEERNRLLTEPVSETDFRRYYYDCLRKGRERLDFVFTDMVLFLRAAGFNGSFVLVDDFERIPSFQSARQMTDFALELRSCLYDGLFESARVGFYNVLLVLHAGVPRLISDAWAESGMANRSPLEQRATTQQHIIPFMKLNREHAGLLLKTYLSAYRISPSEDELSPFTPGAVEKIGELSQYNAALMLKTAYQLLELAVSNEDQKVIDEELIESSKGELSIDLARSAPDIEKATPVDLIRKAQHGE